MRMMHAYMMCVKGESKVNICSLVLVQSVESGSKNRQLHTLTIVIMHYNTKMNQFNTYRSFKTHQKFQRI